MINKKGFTLVELLVAATIIGLLAAFATTQYRNSVAEGRWTQAKAQTDQLANALERAWIDYPNLTFSAAGQMTNVSRDTDCIFRLGMQTSVPINQLIACGYLDNSDWSGTYFTFYSCKNTAGAGCSADYLACMSAKSTARVPASYKNKRYCVSQDGIGIELAL